MNNLKNHKSSKEDPKNTSSHENRNFLTDKEPITLYYHINSTILYELFPVDVGFRRFGGNSEPVRNNYPYYLMHYVIKGSGFVEMNGEKREFGRGSIFILPPDTDLVYYANQKNPWEYYWINFNGTSARKIQSSLGISGQHYYLDKPCPEAKEYFKKSFDAKSNIAGQVYTVYSSLFEIFRLMGFAASQSEVVVDGVKKPFEEMVSYVQEHLFEVGLSESEVANHFFLNNCYFSALFKSNMNTSFTSYVNYERIKKATALIETTDIPIKNIASGVGFSDQFYFSKVFSKYRLMSPLEYRKTHKK